ncbi:hypothetical protein [Planococcus lenghuensis]|uniref:Uncharacterized protein n=1 Tax=Planococcus lenghuensis TaxID=2213202 RepID=A0A1Q2L4I8_9BACL|nr:hypothetical protein [Planococcus lenghuensis]AQQ55375.1 hypothetical protein B0X71_19585 [Planococcus lenghuensis]
MNRPYKLETEDNPKFMEIYINQAWHQVFCYAMAFADRGRDDMLLFTIVSGSDSALQSLKAAIDIGTRSGLRFGYGEKSLTGYEFRSERTLMSEKGKYVKFPMTLSQNRKALAIVHESVLNNTEFVLSFNADPAQEVVQLLGGGQYGLHILPEWQRPVLQELMNQNYLVNHDLYYDEKLFTDGLSLLSIDLDEEEADRFIEEMVKGEKLKFPKSGEGQQVEETADLTSYLLNFNTDMVEKLSETVTPTHNPMEDEPLEPFNHYNRELFPVQSHAATAVAKRLREQKAVILQGEMSTGSAARCTISQ